MLCVVISMIYDGGIMLDKYLMLKETYPKSIIMIKSGSFYECLNEDAIVMNNIFNYKIKKFSKYIRVGYPINRLNYVTSILTKKCINYVIIDNSIINKEKFNYNKYNEYTSINIYDINIKLNTIYNYLNNNRLVRKLKI